MNVLYAYYISSALFEYGGNKKNGNYFTLKELM